MTPTSPTNAHHRTCASRQQRRFRRFLRTSSSNGDCDGEGMLRASQKLKWWYAVVFLVLFQALHSFQSITLSARNYDTLIGLGSGSTTPEQSQSTKHKKHKHMHFCDRGRRNAGFEILRDELGFQRTNALKSSHWDLIYGGYPYCGSDEFWDVEGPDWNFESGLNWKMYHEGGGFDKMRPNQVYHPCMGCGHSYCNKRNLCEMQHEMDPQSCYLLPQHQERLLEDMKNAKKKATWILKTDGGSPSGIHGGKGIRYIHGIEELPPDKQLKRNLHIVQPFVEPYLGKGEMRRKVEVRYYVTITATSPSLRAYAFHESWLPMSTTLFKKHPDSDLERECMQDSHAYRAKCVDVQSRLPDGENRLTWSNWTARVQMPQDQADGFHTRALEMMAYVLKRGSSKFEQDEINMRIANQQAACFSFMRFDFGMAKDVQPFLYEVNEFPYEAEPHQAGDVQKAALRDLFHMIGLDRPPDAETPLPQYRQDYEVQRLGGWIPLDIQNAQPTSSSLRKSRKSSTS